MILRMMYTRTHLTSKLSKKLWEKLENEIRKYRQRIQYNNILSVKTLENDKTPKTAILKRTAKRFS